MIDEPFFNGQSWIVTVKNDAGLTVIRYKFDSEKEANDFIKNTEQQKPKGSENKLDTGSKENKGIK